MMGNQAVSELFKFTADTDFVNMRVFKAFEFRGKSVQALTAVLRRPGQRRRIINDAAFLHNELQQRFAFIGINV